MYKPRNDRAWLGVLPVVLVVAFSAVVPLMVVVNYSVQDILDFNTRFFVAAMRHDQRTLPHAAEAADDDWVTPAQALAKAESNEWQMIDPTLRSLETLSQFADVQSALVGIRSGEHLMPLTPELNAQGMQPLR